MLANTLSVDDEEAVQAELKELQREAVSHCIHRTDQLTNHGTSLESWPQKGLSSSPLSPVQSQSSRNQRTRRPSGKNSHQSGKGSRCLLNLSFREAVMDEIMEPSYPLQYILQHITECVMYDRLNNPDFYHPSNWPKPTFLFFLGSSALNDVAELGAGRLGAALPNWRYFPTPPPTPVAEGLLTVPIFSPNQFTSSWSLALVVGCPKRALSSAAAFFVRFFSARS